MKKTNIRGLLAALIVFVMVLNFAPAAALAHEGDFDDGDATRQVESEDTEELQTTSGDGDEDKQTLRARIEELKQQRLENQVERLNAVKLKVCEHRKAKITSIMNRSVLRAERQLALFTRIAERVKTFYVDKGYTLANYDELVAAVDAAKADAEANLETFKTLSEFECDADDPKGSIEAFKLAVASVRQDLKDYRTSVKNLIVGVKSAANKGAEDEQEGEEQ